MVTFAVFLNLNKTVMKKILIIGAGGQIGSELVPHLRSIYGNNNVVASDINAEKCRALAEAGPFEPLNALDGEAYAAIVKKYGIDTIFNLVALLSATGEKNPKLAWDINIGALTNSLYIAKDNNCAVFTPSSIGAFGKDTPKQDSAGYVATLKYDYLRCLQSNRRIAERLLF